MDEKIKIIYYRENLLQSILSDLFTFSLIFITFSLNHIFVGSGFLNGVLICMFVIWVLSRDTLKKKIFYSIDDAIEHLNKEK